MKQDSEKSPCPVCGRYKNRVMTVDAVVREKGKILLIQRNNEPCRGFWALPGGYMDYNETAEQAAIRELEEETGLKALQTRFLGLYSTPGRHPNQVVSGVYLILEWEGLAVAGDDAGALEWFLCTDLPEKIAFDHEQIINDALKTE
ncbi:MAG: NUDIX hydrolase [Spirochaetales bacterium]|nr:NUDIX hydrolase [Spirochaetales bacterium]